jgi:hypothetical protein
VTVPDLFEPRNDGNIADFGGTGGGKPAELNYNVPLPGAYSWGRVVPIELDPEMLGKQAALAGTSLAELGVVVADGNAVNRVDPERLADFYRRSLPATARPSLRHVAEVGGDVEPLLSQVQPGVDLRLVRDEAAAGAENPVGLGLLARRAVVAEPEDVLIQHQRIDSYISALATQQSNIPNQNRAVAKIMLPMPGIGHSIHPVPIDPVAPPTPRIALIETWELRSYLGDYGLGRTLQTFSLLPGEHTTITMSTWRNEAATREDASSIFDSSDTAAQTRFTSSLSNASGSASQDQGGWSASVSTSVSAGASLFGLVSGSASVSAGFAANHQEASQRYSNSVSQSASDHASQVNNSRRQSVDSSSSTSTASGASTTTVRDITNTNLRRVLNFVFRELNQTYETYVVLRDIKLAFYNGRPGSAEIVPLPELGGLLDKYVDDPGAQEKIARMILGLCAQRFDANGDLVTMLEVGTNPNGISYDWTPATLAGDGSIDFAGDVLAPDVRWRFRQGALSTDESKRSIGGVIMNKSSVVLRTDNIVVEALLGQADALDPYASAMQALDVLTRESQKEATEAETRRITDALAIVAAANEAQKVDIWQKLFPDNPDIEVVQGAAVAAGDGADSVQLPGQSHPQPQ